MSEVRKVIDKGAEAILDDTVNVLADDIRLVLMKFAYDADAGVLADTVLADLAAGDRVAVSASLTGKTATNGVFRADDASFTGVPVGERIGSYWVVAWTGVEATSRLLGITNRNNDSTPIDFTTDASGLLVVEFADGKVFGT